jgi:hypothetical protein
VYVPNLDHAALAVDALHRAAGKSLPAGTIVGAGLLDKQARMSVVLSASK